VKIAKNIYLACTKSSQTTTALFSEARPRLWSRGFFMRQ